MPQSLLPSTASFTITAGVAGAVTLVTGTGGVALPNGNYQIQAQQDGSGVTLVLVTPLGTIEQPSLLQ